MEEVSSTRCVVVVIIPPPPVLRRRDDPLSRHTLWGLCLTFIIRGDFAFMMIHSFRTILFPMLIAIFSTFIILFPMGFSAAASSPGWRVSLDGLPASQPGPALTGLKPPAMVSASTARAVRLIDWREWG